VEWKLFDPGNPPRVADPVFLRDQPWMRLETQPGFVPRAGMVDGMVAEVLKWFRPHIEWVTDIGCGDGAMLRQLNARLLKAGIKPADIWGYDVGAADIAYATQMGQQAQQLDFVSSLETLRLGDLNIMTEVLEHLTDPAGFLAALYTEAMDRGREHSFLVATSPAAETGEWHNEIHLWAWDAAGYRDLFERAGWEVLHTDLVDGGMNTFGGITRAQSFQGLVAVIR
jgi:predicted TPR repeat methyltransferase